jgi:hypothetical protein
MGRQGCWLPDAPPDRGALSGRFLAVATTLPAAMRDANGDVGLGGNPDCERARVTERVATSPWRAPSCMFVQCCMLLVYSDVRDLFAAPPPFPGVTDRIPMKISGGVRPHYQPYGAMR